MPPGSRGLRLRPRRLPLGRTGGRTNRAFLDVLSGVAGWRRYRSTLAARQRRHRRGLWLFARGLCRTLLRWTLLRRTLLSRRNRLLRTCRPATGERAIRITGRRHRASRQRSLTRTLLTRTLLTRTLLTRTLLGRNWRPSTAHRCGSLVTTARRKHAAARCLPDTRQTRLAGCGRAPV